MIAIIAPFFLLLLVVFGFVVVVLALGSLLAHLFAVTVFEAALALLAVILIVSLWLQTNAPASLEQADDEETEPTIIFSSLPYPPRRAPRRRKR